MNRNAEIAIVGGGPVGMLCALALAQTGAKVVVIEQEPGIVNSPRASVYFPSTLLILQELGLLDELLEIGFKNGTFAMHFPEFDYHSVVTTQPVNGIDYDYQLHAGQHEVARVAMEHAQKLGVEILFDHQLIGFEDGPDGVSIQAKSPQGETQINAKWLIGADGARSTVRNLADIEFAGYTWPERFVATNLKCDMRKLGYEQANFVCDPVNMAVIAQLDKAPTAKECLWRLTYMEDSALPEESVRDRIPERYKFFIPEGVEYELVSASPYMLHQRAAETLNKGHVVLVGDAAHATNPCGGLGLTSGIWTGMILADLLGAILRGEEEAAVLDAFSEERRRIFWDVVTPAASDNKRMLHESDPAKRQADLDAVKNLNADPDSGAMLMLFAYRVIGDTLRKNSRWADADPTARVALDISGRKGQIQ